MSKDFTYVTEANSHIKRAREILALKPEIRKLYGPNQWSFAWVLLLVVSQFCIASYIYKFNWIWIVLTAYLLGAFFNHALYVMIHEACHNLIFKSKKLNKIAGLICDLPMVFPGALAFRKYHLIHHRHLNEYQMDPDVVTYQEGNWVKNSSFKKFLWICLFSFSQALRPLKLKTVKMWDGWIVLNFVIQLGSNLIVFYFFGWSGLLYLFLSTFFALGPHPLGGRWIQEHYLFEPDQETYSYYGPINKLGFNIGYHNEHHDFLNISWEKLPLVKKAAPDYYNSLHSHQSLTKVLLSFIFNRDLSPFSRILHPDSRKKL